MSDRMKRQLDININTNVDTQPIKKAEKELNSFFTKYGDKKLDFSVDRTKLIDTKELFKAITAAQRLDDAIESVRRNAPLMAQALDVDVQFANNVKAELKDMMAVFDDKSIVRGFDNDNKDVPIIGDPSEIVSQLKEIKNAINDIKAAFEPLTNALSADDSAVHKMVTTSLSDLNALEAKLGEVYQMMNTISTKPFNVQNVISTGGTSQNDLDQIRSLRKEAKDAYKQVEELYNVESFKTFDVLKTQPSGVETILNYQQAMSDFDLADLAKRIKSRSATSLGVVVDELNEWKNVLLQFNNLRNNVADGSFDANKYTQSTTPAQVGSTTADTDGAKIVDESSVNNTDVIDKIKNLGVQVETQLSEIRSRIEETFNLSTVETNHEHITNVIDGIYQQFVELQSKVKSLDLTLSVPTLSGAANSSPIGDSVNTQVSDNKNLASSYDELSEAIERNTDSSKENGNVYRVYHGTKKGGFNEFDMSKMQGGSLFLTDNRDVAKTYSDSVDKDIDLNSTEQQKGIYTVDLAMKNPYVVDAQGKQWNDIGDIVADTNAAYNMRFFKGGSGSFVYEGRIGNIGEEQHFVEGNEAQVKDAISQLYDPTTAEIILNRLRQQQEILGEGLKPYEVIESQETFRYSKKHQQYPNNASNFVAELAYAQGHDGVIFKNMVDYGGGDGSHAPSTVYAVRNAEQAKIVDPTVLPDMSTQGSVGQISAEAKAMQEVAAEATSAAQAKEKFAAANQSVASSATITSQEVEQEASKIAEVAGAVVEANTGLDKVTYVKGADGAPISKTKKSSEIRENAVRTTSTSYTYEDGAPVEQTTTIVDDFKKRAADLKKESDKIALAQKTVNKFVSQFESKTAGHASTITGFDDLKNLQIGSLDDIDKATQAMLELDSEYNKVTQSFRQGTKSMNPFVNAITGIDEMGNKIKETEMAFDELNNAPDKLFEDVSQLSPLLEKMKSFTVIDDSGKTAITDIYALSEAYGDLNVKLRQVNSDIKLQKQVEGTDAQVDKSRVSAYEDIIKAQEKYYDLQKKMVNLDPQSSKGQETLRKLTEAQKEYNAALAEQNKLTVGQLESVRSSKQKQEVELSTLQQEHDTKIATEQEEKDLQYLISLYKQYTDAAVSLKKMQIGTDTDGTANTEKQAAAIKAVQDAKSNLLSLGVDVNKIAESELLTERQINTLLEERVKYQNQIQDIEAAAADKAASKVNKQNQNYGRAIYNRESRNYDTIGANLRQIEFGADFSDDFSQKIAQYKSQFNELQSLREKFVNDPSAANNTGLKNQFQDTALSVEQLRKEISATIKESQRLSSLPEGSLLGRDSFDSSKFEDAQSAMQALAAQVTNGQFKFEGFNATGTEMYGVVEKGAGVFEKITVSLDAATNAIYAHQTGTKQVSTVWQQLGATLKNSALQVARMYLSLNDMIRYVRQGVTEVREIDTALTELKKVTDETDESYDKFLQTMSQSASRTGSTIKELTTSAAD